MDSMPGLLTSRQRCGVTRPVMMCRFSERMTAAPSVSAGVIGPREAVRAKVDRPDAWTGRPSRCAIVGLAVSASTRRVGPWADSAVAMPTARVVRPGAPDVPQTASTLPGAEGGGGGGSADEAAAGVERRVRVAAMRELTTWSGLRGAATDATPRAMRRERS